MTQAISRGYQLVKLRVPSIMNSSNRRYEIRYKIHRIVCRNFNGPPDNDDMVVCHIDNNRMNNNSNNLRWVPVAIL